MLWGGGGRVKLIPLRERPSLLSIPTKVGLTPRGSDGTDRISNMNCNRKLSDWNQTSFVRSNRKIRIKIFKSANVQKTATPTDVSVQNILTEQPHKQQVHSCSLSLKPLEPLVLIRTLSHRSVPPHAAAEPTQQCLLLHMLRS